MTDIVLSSEVFEQLIKNNTAMHNKKTDMTADNLFLFIYIRFLR